MTIKFPKLEKLVNSNAKLDDNNPRKLIYVLDGYAIVSNDIIAIVDLREYIKREMNINAEYELGKLSELVGWMNGKAFNKSYWSELSKDVMLSEIDTENDSLEIENCGYNKTLHYIDVDADFSHVLSLIKSNIMRAEVSRERASIKGDHLTLITTAFKNELKGDNLLLSLAAQGTGVRFSLQQRDYIFGIVPENFESSMDMLAFDNCSKMMDVLNSNGVEAAKVEETLDDLWNDDEQNEDDAPEENNTGSLWDDDDEDEPFSEDEFNTMDIKD